MRIKLWHWIVVLGALGALAAVTRFDLLPPLAEYRFEPEVGAPQSATGSAFSIGGGVWITARHVVDRCDSVWLAGIGDQVPHRVTTITYHSHADASLLVADIVRPGLPVARRDTRFERGIEAVHVGFPAAEPAFVPTLYTGAQSITRPEYGPGAARNHFWAVAEPEPGGRDYGGLSGGPVLAPNGAVIGVVVGSVSRLNRIIAHDAGVIWDLLDRQGAIDPLRTPHPPSNQALSDPGSAILADTALQRRQVVLVYCAIA